MNVCGRRDFLKVSTASTAGFALAGCQVFKKEQFGRISGRPNLLFVFPDQFRVQALGFTGEDPTITPHLNRFANESKFFTNAVSNRPLCTPFRGMLLTGRWPHSTNLYTNCNSSVPDIYLRKDEQTITDVLAESGYSVGYIGKWHLDTPKDVPPATSWEDPRVVWDAYTPLDRRHGIDFWYSYGGDNVHTTPHYWIGDASKEERTDINEYSPEHEAKIATHYIKNMDGKYRDPGKPFTLFVSMNPPHPKYEDVPEKYREFYKGKTAEELLNRPNVDPNHERSHKSVADYFAAVTAVDMAFGKILQALEESGQADNTIVVFTSDHGEMMGSHGLMQKVVYYEESFRIPLLIRWPGKIRPGTDGLHINVPDYMPTLLDLMGLEDRIPKQVEGVNYAPVLFGADMPRPNSTYYMSDTDYPDKITGVKRGVRTDRYTFVVEQLDDGTYNKILFDNQEDPYQMKSVVEENPAVVRELSTELIGWLKRTKDPYLEDFRTALGL